MGGAAAGAIEFAVATASTSFVSPCSPVNSGCASGYRQGDYGDERPDPFIHPRQPSKANDRYSRPLSGRLFAFTARSVTLSEEKKEKEVSR